MNELIHVKQGYSLCLLFPALWNLQLSLLIPDSSNTQT